MVRSLLLMDSPMSSIRVPIASMVDSQGLNPNCFLKIILFISRWVMSLSWIMCSSSLPGVGRREMGRRSETDFEFLTLGMGITVAIFQSWGTVEVEILRLNRYKNSGIIQSIASLSSLVLMSGSPDDLWMSMRLISFNRVLSVMGSNISGGFGARSGCECRVL